MSILPKLSVCTMNAILGKIPEVAYFFEIGSNSKMYVEIQNYSVIDACLNFINV